MDPNLKTIIDANASDIKRGKIGKAAHHAKDYLTYMNGFNTLQSEREYKEFITHVKGMRKEK